MVNIQLPPIPRPISVAIPPAVPSVEDCKDCRGLENIRAMTKNREIINATINSMKYMGYLYLSLNNSNRRKNTTEKEKFLDLHQVKNLMMV